MKVKVTKKDGEIWELEGSAEEIAKVLAPQTVQLSVQATPPVSVPSIWSAPTTYDCPMGGHHQWPAWWLSVSPPACEKCGQTMWAEPSWSFQPLVVDDWNQYPTVTEIRLEGDHTPGNCPGIVAKPRLP